MCMAAETRNISAGTTVSIGRLLLTLAKVLQPPEFKQRVEEDRNSLNGQTVPPHGPQGVAHELRHNAEIFQKPLRRLRRRACSLHRRPYTYSEQSRKLGCCRSCDFYRFAYWFEFFGSVEMSKKQPKLTPWFPANVRPVHVGVYKTEGNVFQYWTGARWGLCCDDKNRAAARVAISHVSLFQHTKWRGLAVKP